MKLIIYSGVLLLLISCHWKRVEVKGVPEEESQVIVVDSMPEDTLSQTEKTLEKQGLVLISDAIPSILIDLKYATDDNFTKKILYHDLRKAYLHPIAIEKLKRAQKLLKDLNPKFSLLIYDAARPLSIQQEMYDAVKNTRYHLYVAHPDRTSLHNYGLAVDLTIHDGEQVLDMGTSFDYFGKEAGIYREEEFLRVGILKKEQVENRKMLRNVMIQAEFQPIRGEWWHFNACSLQEARHGYQIIK